MAQAVAIQGNNIFFGEREDETNNIPGDLYSGSIAGCPTTVSFSRVDSVEHGVIDIVFRANGSGVLASYDGGIYYTRDGGTSWESSDLDPRQFRSVAVIGSTFYALSQTAGIYQSDNGGSDWVQIASVGSQLQEPLNSLSSNPNDSNSLWINTSTGAYAFVRNTNQVVGPWGNGLSGVSLDVWDLAFNAAGTPYVATSDGVFELDSSLNWQRFGTNVTGIPFFSLEIFGGVLYAGAQGPGSGSPAGVWQRPLNGGDWQPVDSAGWNRNSTVRDLLYDHTHCDGLLAATDDGIWLYAQP